MLSPKHLINLVNIQMLTFMTLYYNTPAALYRTFQNNQPIAKTWSQFQMLSPKRLSILVTLKCQHTNILY
jgi:hypothetical protein